MPAPKTKQWPKLAWKLFVYDYSLKFRGLNDRYTVHLEVNFYTCRTNGKVVNEKMGRTIKGSWASKLDSINGPFAL
jgi:hypothetical protein